MTAEAHGSSRDHVAPVVRRRHAVRNANESGFVLMEALVALILLALMLGLFAATLGFGRRIASAGTARDHMAEIATGTEALATWLSAAVPARKLVVDGFSSVQFEGSIDGLAFNTLSNGDVLPGGLLAVAIAARGGSIAFEAAPLPVGQDRPVSRSEQRILLDRVASARFSYYGSPRSGAPARWYDEWRNAERMPRLVGLQTTMMLHGRVATMDFMFRVMSD
jgi:general secretion pathway protein J